MLTSGQQTVYVGVALPLTKATRKDEEHRLLQHIAEGDQEVFWALWEQYRPLFSRYCLRWMGGNREDAEAALSGASLRALHKLPAHFAGPLARLTMTLVFSNTT